MCINRTAYPGSAHCLGNYGVRPGYPFGVLNVSNFIMENKHCLSLQPEVTKS